MLNAPFTPTIHDETKRYSLRQISMIFLFAYEKINPKPQFFMKEPHEEKLAEYFNKKILDLLDTDGVNFPKLKQSMELVLNGILTELKMTEHDLNIFWGHLIKDCFTNGNVLDNNPIVLCFFKVFLDNLKKYLKEVETLKKENMPLEVVAGMQNCMLEFIGQLTAAKHYHEAQAIHNFIHLARYIAISRIEANCEESQQDAFNYLAPLIGPCLLHGLRLKGKIEPNVPVLEYKLIEKFTYALLASPFFSKDYNNVDYSNMRQSFQEIDHAAEHLWDYASSTNWSVHVKAQGVEAKESEGKRNKLTTFLSKMSLGKAKETTKAEKKLKKSEKNTEPKQSSTTEPDKSKENLRPESSSTAHFKTADSSETQATKPPKSTDPATFKAKLKKHHDDELSRSLTDLTLNVENKKDDKKKDENKVKLMSTSAGTIPHAGEFNFKSMEQPQTSPPKDPAQENQSKSILFLKDMQNAQTLSLKGTSAENNNNNARQLRTTETHKKIKRTQHQKQN